ncbi:MAG: FAD-binding and (Fe-S)-binding domain-containing protein [Rhodospirillales bacterium]
MSGAVAIGDSGLARRLRRAIAGEVLFDAFSRGRYSTDASIYQVEPIGVVVPRTAGDIRASMQIAREAGAPVLPRGAGTSQCGQTVGRALVIDASKHLNKVIALDAEKRRVTVEPGVVMDRLNAYLRPHGLFFPVDVSPSNRATIGGMAGNNSCGARSIRYGNMVHNVAAIDAILPDGEELRFGPVGEGGGARADALWAKLRELALAEADEIKARFPRVLRRVGGYNIDELTSNRPNLARLLVGSEGTLAFSTRIELDLQPIPKHRALGICHFPRFYAAMEATKHIVKLEPTAVELVDRTMIALARDIPMFKATVDRFVMGAPDALLLVEFAGDDQADVLRRLKRLVGLMGDLGFPDAVVEATDPAFQRAVWDVRSQGLNIMMSMKGEGKPVSFIEDCAVPLEHLAEYTDRLTRIFRKHGTDGTWYAHASVGTLHVRPVLNLKLEKDARAMRAIAEECFAMVREYKGSHSGEHGDGLVRSEFHEAMFGSRIVRAFERVKEIFDPGQVMNPGKIVHPSRMDDRSLFRYRPGYAAEKLDTAFDWSAWGGFGGAIEMCNNNGACRRTDAGVMCPSFRVTGDEIHLTRGRANTLRLALSGQLGADAMLSPEMKETMALCVGCKGCRRECPTGVDMAKMKLEWLAQYRRKVSPTLRERLVAHLPDYAPAAARLAPLMNLGDALPALREKIAGFSARRKLPKWRSDALKDSEAPGPDADVLLFADCFTRWFEPQIPRAALRVLGAAGRKVAIAGGGAQGNRRPLCCGRTYLAAGLVDRARAEAGRTIAALKGKPVVGLEPSCLLTLRDEYPALLPGADAGELAKRALLFEEYLTAETKAGRLGLKFKSIGAARAWLHGHCHQKAFGLLGGVAEVLALVPGLKVETVESSCCGMAGPFGYEAEHYDASMKMAELSLLPALRGAGADEPIVADGTSCRHQIEHGLGRRALHAAELLERALA